LFGEVDQIADWRTTSYYKEYDKASDHCADITSVLHEDGSSHFDINMNDAKTVWCCEKVADVTCLALITGKPMELVVLVHRRKTAPHHNAKSGLHSSNASFSGYSDRVNGAVARGMPRSVLSESQLEQTW